MAACRLPFLKKESAGMTINEAIDLLDVLKANKYTDDQKRGWLSELDGQIYKEIIQTHAPDEHTPESFAGYDAGTDGTTELLVPSPYSDLYMHYLSMKVDLYNTEIVNYNNDKDLFNGAYDSYAQYYNRTHMPIQAVRRFNV